jgi:multicomponent Na+:H+ antiporter subunit B
VPERAGTDAVSDLTFDYRAFDTLGEEFILFAAAVGVSMLLRAQRDEREEEAQAEAAEQRQRATSDALRALAVALVGPTVVLGLYTVAHGALWPGGGFQGGVILAAALVLVFVAGQYATMRRVRPMPLVELAEGLGVAGFTLLGIGGLVFAGAFFENFLPLGTPGDLLSGGFIPVASVAVGIEVAGATVILISEFLEQVMVTRGAGE